MISFYDRLLRLIFVLASAAVLTQASIEMHHVAWGTGIWLGEYSLKWGLGFFGFAAGCLGLFIVAVLVAWWPERWMTIRLWLTRTRNRLPLPVRGGFALTCALAPVLFFQYTMWGVVFAGPGMRLLVWGLSTLGLAIAIGRGEQLLGWKESLIASLVGGALIGMAIPLATVTDYPFSLGWSEGNRLWDYSVLFGRERYLVPPGMKLAPFLDVGRQLIGGLPFLYPNLTILQERLWLGLIGILPYVLLSWSMFHVPHHRLAGVPIPALPWLLAGLWGFLFLRQGPIHPPLLISAILVALVWRRSLWIAVPVLIAAGYFAAVSRFTWTFAPAMWAGMLWFSSADPQDQRLDRRDWHRTIALALAGLVGGLLLPQLTGVLTDKGNTPITQVTDALTRQPLLWYRLLPNSTYPPGVLLGLLLAVLPLILVLAITVWRGLWRPNFWQRLAVLGALGAFLIVGLIASTKIGGGGDLHNLDMFLIGLLFTASIAWEKNLRTSSGKLWITEQASLSPWLRLLLIVMVMLPAYNSLMRMRPLLYADDFQRLKVLADVEDPYADPRVLGLLPPRQKVREVLDVVRARVQEAAARGEVLFMDQRQLLTFGYIQGVPLVPEYEKKYLMDQAMGETAALTFPAFYRDLGRHRFTLIISDPLRLPIKDSEYGFGEENNAWVKWVAVPILCYYEPDKTFKEFRIQLLIPRAAVSPDCALPVSP